MPKRKATLPPYYFSTEGETEVWYFERLMELINGDERAAYKVSLNPKKKKDPFSYAKGLPNIYNTIITHVCDWESESEEHKRNFAIALERMAKVKELGRKITYQLGYSNFTFELWIILHKTDCNGVLSNRHQYLAPINKAFSENFENLDEYKEEANFKKILRAIEIDDVISAVNRAKKIMGTNKENGYILQNYKGYKYYTENPSLSVWEIVEKILKDCGLLN